MLDCYEELRSAQRVVPYLSHGTFASLEFWLRGRATNIICSFGAPRKFRHYYAFLACSEDLRTP
jgi:hypothetical protein